MVSYFLPIFFLSSPHLIPIASNKSYFSNPPPVSPPPSHPVLPAWTSHVSHSPSTIPPSALHITPSAIILRNGGNSPLTSFQFRYTCLMWRLSLHPLIRINLRTGYRQMVLIPSLALLPGGYSRPSISSSDTQNPGLAARLGRTSA